MWRDASETIAAAAAGKRLSLTLAQRSSIHYHDRRKEIKKIFLHRRQKKIQLEKHADHSVRHLGLPVQEIWANAHETRESSFCSQSCLDLCLSISSQFTFLQPKIGKITKTPYFGGSRSFKVIDVDTTKKHVTSACYDKCNRFQAGQDNSGKIITFQVEYPSLTPTCAGFVKRRGSGLRLLKPTFNAKNFICRLF